MVSDPIDWLEAGYADFPMLEFLKGAGRFDQSLSLAARKTSEDRCLNRNSFALESPLPASHQLPIHHQHIGDECASPRHGRDAANPLADRTAIAVADEKFVVVR